MMTMKRLAVVTLAALLVAGCAGFGKGPSDEEMIQATVQKLKLGLESKNLDKIMEPFADDFSTKDASSKAKLRDFLQQAIDMGYLDDAECDIKTITIKIEPDKKTATVAPVDLSGGAGSISLEVTLGKRDITVGGKTHTDWLITSLGEN